MEVHSSSNLQVKILARVRNQEELRPGTFGSSKPAKTRGNISYRTETKWFIW